MTDREKFFLFISMMTLAFACAYSMLISILTAPAFAHSSFGLLVLIFIMGAFFIFAEQG